MVQFRQCGHRLHEEKTKIVYCGTGKLAEGGTIREFGFPGYTFRRRTARRKKGKIFTSFIPAVCKKVAKSIRSQVKEIESLQRTVSNLRNKQRNWLRRLGDGLRTMGSCTGQKSYGNFGKSIQRWQARREESSKILQRCGGMH